MARRGESVMLLRVGQLRIALPGRGGAPGDAAGCRRRGRARRPDAGDAAATGWSPSCRSPASTASRRPSSQLLLEGVVSGQPLALAVDTVEGEQEVLVRPITRRAPTDRLLEGVALLASGEPVGVLSPSVLSQREYLRALPAARPQVGDPARARAAGGRLAGHPRDGAAPAGGRRLRGGAAPGDAEEALSLLGEESFDCVVTDIEMPRMDGFELAAQLRGMEHFAHLPIIVVSTRDRPEDRLRGLKVGADAYLTKQSLDAGELVDLVRRLSGSGR